jgi:DNA replication and repair protein RecF
VTTIGPHRDELRLLSNGIDLGDYGSRGQVRTALLALKLAEVTWIKNRTGEWPCCCWMRSWPSWIPSAAATCKAT